MGPARHRAIGHLLGGFVALLVLACQPATSRPSAEPTTSSAPASRSPSIAASTPPACRPTDQDGYVYHPARLVVLAACIGVRGTVEAIRSEPDGDVHIRLHLDSAFGRLLRPANETAQHGDLVVEAICVRPVAQPDAIAACAADPDPLSVPLPPIGTHVWMEGRYVLDMDHGGWAELHPLYRWGYLP